MDVQGISDTAYRDLGLLALQRKLALRLTQAGYGVVAPKKAPQIRLLFSANEKKLTLAVEAAGSSNLSREVVRGEGKLETFHLEVIHHAVALVRRAEQALPPPPAPASLPVKPPANHPVSTGKGEGKGKGRGEGEGKSRGKGVEPWHLELSAGAVALYRPGGVDPMIRGNGRVGIWRDLGIRGSVGVSLSLPDEGVIVELAFQGGLSWRFDLTRSLYLEPGLLVGFSQHIYHMEDLQNPSGLRWGFITTVPLELGWRLHERVAVRLWVAPGVGVPPNPHEVGPRGNTEVVWSRSWFRLEGGLVGVLILR